MKKFCDAAFYWIGVYTACDIVHNVIRRLTRPRYHTVKGGGRNVE